MSALEGRKTLIGIALLLVPAIRDLAGWDLPAEAVTTVIDAAFSLLGGVLAIYGRFVAKGPVQL